MIDEAVICCVSGLNVHLAENEWNGNYVGVVLVGSRAYMKVDADADADVDVVVVLTRPLQLHDLYNSLVVWQPTATFIAAMVPIVRMPCPVCGRLIEVSQTHAIDNGVLPPCSVLSLEQAQSLSPGSCSIAFAVWAKSVIGTPSCHEEHLQCVRSWARRRCIYGTVNGFPGGAAYVVIFFFATCFSVESCPLQTFARFFVNWKFPRPIGSDSEFLSLTKKQAVPLIVTQPGFPYINMTHATSVVQLSAIRWECEQVLLHKELPPFPLEQVALRVILVGCNHVQRWFDYVSAMLAVTMPLQMLFCAHTCRCFPVEERPHSSAWMLVNTAFALYSVDGVSNAPVFGRLDVDSGCKTVARMLASAFRTRYPSEGSDLRLRFVLKDINTSAPLWPQLRIDDASKSALTGSEQNHSD
jgi:hypothetical protein